ncbi:BolA family protein [Aurantiacibacter aquimixticola]|uniref:BolA family transcriptional regulator n=1 Tax=Aurantiacibacter aquimixticola TaxID=1958945 RepID=A0A419RQW0_9SPHN|nr:BolA family protein [Aurantiacibacter aquimixticola]RJY08183.1 BolA family transcriptional regulator [Aurantiacibacter aquimixticola]
MAGEMQTEIEMRLREELSPTRLEVINDSAHHAGHSGDDGSGESHFTVIVESSQFDGMSRLARQRKVLAALGDIPGERVHAFAMKCYAPGEAPT